jgi:radical SAM superfamily enzyme YgiQ (UPF0313 family)
MKVVLVLGKYFNSWEALGLGYIASYLKREIEDIEMKFFHGSFDSEEEIILNSMNADYVFFSCTSPTFKYCLNLAHEIKNINPKVRTVFGGYHHSSLPQQTVSNDAVDQVVVGEGEQASVDILKGLRSEIVFGQRMQFRNYVWPDRKLIKNERNIHVAYEHTGLNITSFQSVRCCPFKCKFCADGNSVIYGKNIKPCLRAAKDLLNEMEYVTKEYKLDFLKFCDATWNIDLDFVKSFCREKIKRNFQTPFFSNIHANVVDKEMFELMVEANCKEIGIGIESGSPKILKQIGKGTTVESISKACELAKEAGIEKIRGYFIIGMPDETDGDIRLTEKFAEILPIDEYGFTILCPYPGSLIYEENKEALQDIAWEDTDEYHNDFWETKTISNKELIEWQQRLTDKFSDSITWHQQQIGEKV